MSEPEFAVGDTVHYRGAPDHPEDGYPVTVREVRRGMFGPTCFDGTPDERIFYSLRGHGYLNPGRRLHHFAVVTDCTGRSILESKLYFPPEP